MTNHKSGPPTSVTGSSQTEGRRRLARLLLAVMLACGLALGVWAVVQAGNRTSAAEESTQPATGASATTGESSTPTSSGAPATAGPKASAPPTGPATKEPAPAPTANTPTTAPGPALSKDSALAAVPQPVAAAVPLDEAAAVKPGLGVSVGSIAAVTGEAQGIGEIAGPAVQFIAVVANNSGADMPASSIAVTVEYGKDKTPAVQLSGPGATEFPAVIANGETGSATFVFNVPVEQRDQVRILVSLNASSPIAAFEGAVSDSKGTP